MLLDVLCRRIIVENIEYMRLRSVENLVEGALGADTGSSNTTTTSNNNNARLAASAMAAATATVAAMHASATH